MKAMKAAHAKAMKAAPMKAAQPIKHALKLTAKNLKKLKASSSHMTPMKKPMKKPAAANPSKATGLADISQLTLMKLKGKSEEEIKDYISGLENGKQQLLWKKYESMRKMQGTDAEYKAATSGTGQIMKKNKALIVWLKTGDTKSKEHRPHSFHLITVGVFSFLFAVNSDVCVIFATLAIQSKGVHCTIFKYPCSIHCRRVAELKTGH